MNITINVKDEEYAYLSFEDADNTLYSLCEQKAEEMPFVRIMDDKTVRIRKGIDGGLEDILAFAMTLQDKTDCTVKLITDTVERNIRIWYSAQLNCFAGGFFYTSATA